MTLNLNLFIVIATVIISFMAFNNAELFNKLKFNAYLECFSGYHFVINRFLTTQLSQTSLLDNTTRRVVSAEPEIKV